jgi:hypothetical protein
VLEQELVRAEAESLGAEAQLSNITREKLKAAFTYQFDALREHCEKIAIIAGYGKHLLELVDDTPVTPGETRQAYDGYDASKAIIQDCEDALTNWVTSSAAVRSNLSTRSRTLSQRRANNIKRGVEDDTQDSLKEQHWVPDDQHADYHVEDVSDDGVVEDDGSITHAGANGEHRGRTEEREPVAA